MVEVYETLTQMKVHWGNAKPAFHRGAEIPFKLRCSFKSGIEEEKLSAVELNLPLEVKEFYRMTDGAVLFEDVDYSQWGLKIYALEESAGATSRYLDERNRESLKGDLIIGEFFGDSDLLLLRCDPKTDDYGSIIVVSAIDSRAYWDVAAKDLNSFLQKLYSCQGDKYWEL